MKIAEKEAAEKARLAEIASRVSTTHPPGRAEAVFCGPDSARPSHALTLTSRPPQNDDDPVARKAREQAAQLRSDMDNAASLFGASNISGKLPPPLLHRRRPPG